MGGSSSELPEKDIKTLICGPEVERNVDEDQKDKLR